LETDETYFSPKKPRKGHPKVKKQNTDVVLGMIERGGKLRMVPIADGKMKSIEPVVVQNISPDALLQTDMSMVYSNMGARLFPGQHRMIDHIYSYAQGENHTNTVENAFSLLKRGVYGTFHKVSIKHLARYCNEFSYRFNRRDDQEGMFAETVKRMLNGERLPYKQLTA
jgi:ISXO2-like transposase domain